MNRNMGVFALFGIVFILLFSFGCITDARTLKSVATHTTTNAVTGAVSNGVKSTTFNWNDVTQFNTEALPTKGTAYASYIELYLRFYLSGNSSSNIPATAHLPVEVSIYTSKANGTNSAQRIPDRLLYTGNFTITDLAKASSLAHNDKHILVPRGGLGSIKDTDMKYGVAVVKVTLPNKKVLTDNAYLVKLKE